MLIFHSRERVGDRRTLFVKKPPTSRLIGILADTAAGMYGTDEVYSDLDVEKFEKLPPTQPHRGVDLEMIAADKQGKGLPI